MTTQAEQIMDHSVENEVISILGTGFRPVEDYDVSEIVKVIVSMLQRRPDANVSENDIWDIADTYILSDE